MCGYRASAPEVQQQNLIRMRGQQRPLAGSLCDEIHV